MKKKIIFIIFLLIASAFSREALAGGTTCTIYLSAQAGHLISYEIQFEIFDSWNGNISYTGPTSWVPVSIGTNTNFSIPLDVVPDCTNRWIVRATVRQLYNGIPTGSTDADSCGPMSSDSYYQGGFAFYLSI